MKHPLHRIMFRRRNKMTIIAIISEYNPFHLGHKYMIEQIRHKYRNATLISIMSGSFVQRGEPAIVDKWTRAEIAIQSGINLVIELPFYYSCQPAEDFAKGAVQLIQSIGCVDFLAFGGETNDITPLLIAAEISSEIQNDNASLRKKMDHQLSFSEAKLSLISELFERHYNDLYDKFQINSMLRKSNNILAIEYLKNLFLKNSSIQPLLIQRKGSEYGSEKLSGSFSSASAIRIKLRTDKDYNGMLQMPKIGVEKIKDFVLKYEDFHQLDKYENLIFYLLDNLSTEELTNVYCADFSLVKRILNMRKKAISLNHLTELSTNIGISKSRIQRFYCQLLNGLCKNNFSKLTSDTYLRVLASDSKGFMILKRSAQLGNTVISKFSTFHNYAGLTFESKVTDNYFSVLKHKCKNKDYLTSPILKK